MENLSQKWIDEIVFLDKEKRINDILKRKFQLFRAKMEEGADLELFLELTFCLMTAQTRFDSALKVQNQLLYDDKFYFRLVSENDADLEKYMAELLRANRIRFHNNKANNIVKARNLFFEAGRLKLRHILDNFKDEFSARDYLIENVCGLSYKESSHFLRNIGRGKNLAILDRHILRLMKMLNIIDELPSSLNKGFYLEYEAKLRDFSDFLGIELEKMDFLLFILSKRHLEQIDTNIFALLEDLK